MRGFSKYIAGMWRAIEWGFDGDSLYKFINECNELGVTSFDHAAIYGDYNCEKLFGAAMKSDKSLREKIQIVTKCGIRLISKNKPENYINHYDTSKDHILESVNDSLNNLKTDYIDLLLIHRPDPLMNADEIAEAFNELKVSGKVLNFGVSNFTVSQFKLLGSRLGFPLITNQVEFSLMTHDPMENGVFDYCQQSRINPMIWSPLAGGKIFTEKNEFGARIKNKMYEVANELNCGLDQLALSWILRHPVNPYIVLGTGRIERIKSALMSEKINLTRQQWFSLLKAAKGHDVP